MELIVNFVVWTLTLIAALLTNIIAHDICGSADRVCTKIIRSASGRLAPSDTKDVELEWLGDLSERETVTEKYRHAIGCYFAAARMRRQAETLAITISLGVAGVGTVPLNLKLSPSILAFAFFKTAGAKMPRVVRISSISIFVFYVFAKLWLSARRLGPGSSTRFVNEMKRFKDWDYDARITKKGLDADISPLFKAIVLNPNRIAEIFKTWHDAFMKSIASQRNKNPNSI
ncbi:MAG: hypothetical protein ABSC72_03480 [Methylovirgula sp.]|jgi:hypothetical protein